MPDEELTGHCEVVMGLQKELAECKESMATKQGKNDMPSLWNLQPERRCILYVLRCGTSGRRGRKRGDWFTQGSVEETEEETKEKEGKEPEKESEEVQKKETEKAAPEQDAEQEVWDACVQKEDGDDK